jgi:RNA polymerase sigma-70 factor (ECF subfamily)
VDRARAARFEDYFTAEHGRLVGAIALFTGDRDAAIEAVADAMAKAWERISRGEEIDNLGAWMRVSAFNAARGTFRRRSRERDAMRRLIAATATPMPDPAPEAMDVRELLAQLSQRQREVVVMHYFLELDVAEIAHELRLSQGTVRNFLQRARSKLLGIAGAIGADDERADNVGRQNRAVY